MEDSMKLYWELVFKKMATKGILRQMHNPLREYEDELITGAIVDVGCGQSPLMLDFASAGRELIAIDNDQTQLDYLRQRIQNETGTTPENWNFYHQGFPEAGLPDKVYAAMIFSNLLHFFTLNECVEIGKLISKRSVSGTLVFIEVHSDKHHSNNPKDPNNNHYFKHYFTRADVELVFPMEEFERLYYAEIEKLGSKVEMELMEEWLPMSLKADGIIDLRLIEQIERK